MSGVSRGKAKSDDTGGSYLSTLITTASLKDRDLREFFEPFDPRNLLVSNNDGLFSQKFAFEKDYLLGFKHLIKP